MNSMNLVLCQAGAAVCAGLLLVFGAKLFQRLASIGLLCGAFGFAMWGLIQVGVESAGLRVIFSALAALAAISIFAQPLARRWGAVIMNFIFILIHRYLSVAGGILTESEANWLTGVLGGLAILSSFASIGALAGLLLAYAASIPPAAGWQFIVLVAGCLVVAWLRHGRLPASAVAIAPSEIVAMARRGGQPSSNLIRLAVAFDCPLAMRHFQQTAMRRGWCYEPLSDLSCAIVEMPRELAAATQRLGHLLGLFSLGTPALAERADVRCTLPTLPQSSDYGADHGIGLSEIRNLLRTDFKNRRLPENQFNGDGAHVAVLDTGGEERPEYAGVINHRLSFVPGESVDDRSDCRHGSNCGMIINSVAPRAKISFLKVLANNGSGMLEWILQGYQWCVENGVDVVSASYGSCSCRGASTCFSCRAVESLRSKGVIFVASAGNSGPGPSSIGCPGGSSGAITVASASRHGRISSFSSRGPSVDPSNPKPDVTAFGEAVLLRRRVVGANTEPLNGTSFSCPQVSGLAAVLVAEVKHKGERADVEKMVRRAILDGCRSDRLAPEHRNAHASGRGMICVSSSLQLLPTQTNQPLAALPEYLPWVLRRAAAPVAACAVIIGLRITLLDSANSLTAGNKPERSVTLLGRVVETRDGRLLLEDGTGSVWLTSSNPHLSPQPGNFIWVHGIYCPKTGRVDSSNRILLASSNIGPGS